MVNKHSNAQNNCQGIEDSLDTLKQEDEGNYVITGSKSKRLIRWVNPHQALVLTSKDTLFKTANGFEYRIPKPMVSLDEKYLRRCLESIHFQASTMTRCNVPDNKMTFFIENSSPLGTRTGFESPSLLFDCPIPAGTGNGTGTALAGQWILGAAGSESATRTFRRYGASSDSNNADRPIRALSLSLSASSTPTRLEIGNSTPAAAAIRKRVVSVSPTTTTNSSSSRASAAAGVGQGMVKLTRGKWGPRFVFSSDSDRGEVYVASSEKAGAAGDHHHHHVYSFSELRGGGSRDAGEMRVSRSLAVAGDGSEVAETEFVLSGAEEEKRDDAAAEEEEEVVRSSPAKRRGLTRKVAEALGISKLAGTRPAAAGGGGGGGPPASLELAAVVVRDRAREEEESGGGGWGLKFLKKVKVNDFGGGGDCSTSMDVLIPAGLHGGTRTRSGGPASLSERWKSGGKCDCGGWDVGCPLTVLKPRPSNNEVEEEEEDDSTLREEFKSFDLFAQGSDRGAPTMRLVTVQDDLYFVHFRRTLSILQSFAIAVAIIHSRSPNLRHKDVHEI